MAGNDDGTHSEAIDCKAGTFDTARLPAAQRFAAFQAFTRDALEPVFRSDHPDVYQGTMALHRLGDLTGFSLATSSLVAELRADAAGAERVCIEFCEAGSVGIDQGCELVTAGPGDAVISPSHVGGRNYCADGTRLSAVVVRRDLLPPGTPWPVRGRVIRGADPTLRLLHRWIGFGLADPSARHPPVAETYERITIDLAAMLLRHPAQGPSGDEAAAGRQARLRLILDSIAAGAARPGFRATEVAARLEITPRYVRKLLEETGKTFSEHLLEARLQRARAFLADPNLAARRISDLALAAGFGDLSYFNRTFRRRFGETPLGVRTRARSDDDA
jgi:AraC-like DNA-binding protein